MLLLSTAHWQLVLLHWPPALPEYFRLLPCLCTTDDIGHDGMQLIRDIVHIFNLHGLPTKVLSASIRHPTHAVESAKAGAYAGTMPFKVRA